MDPGILIKELYYSPVSIIKRTQNLPGGESRGLHKAVISREVLWNHTGKLHYRGRTWERDTEGVEPDR